MRTITHLCTRLRRRLALWALREEIAELRALACGADTWIPEPDCPF